MGALDNTQAGGYHGAAWLLRPAASPKPGTSGLEVGEFCAEYQDKAFRNLKCARVQVDEMWSFCCCKQKQVTAEMAEERVAGDVWLWSAIDAETKLVPCWYVGQRDAIAATESKHARTIHNAVA